MSRRSIQLLTCLLVTGCSTVSSHALLGDPAPDEITKQLEGVWLGERGVPLWVKHVNGNELRVAGLEWRDDQSRFALEEMKAFVTQDEEINYINILAPDSADAPDRYYFMRVGGSAEGDAIVLLMPRADVFAGAVENGALPGEVLKDWSGKSVQLAATAEQLNAFVDPAKAGEHFDLETMPSLRRVTRLDDEKSPE